MKRQLAVAAGAVFGAFAWILLESSLSGVAPVVTLAVLFVGLLVARKVVSSGARR